MVKLYILIITQLCFPEGISIKKKPDNPKWFSFIVTNTQLMRSFCSVVIFTEELTENYFKSVSLFNN